MNTIRLIMASVLIFSCTRVFACLGVHQESVEHPDKLISRTSNIVLAVVVSARWDNKLTDLTLPALRDYEYPTNADLVQIQTDVPRIEYELFPLKILKGDVSSNFILLGDAVTEDNFISYENHSNDFVSNKQGRFIQGVNCKILPSFTVGGLYLIFLDEPHHRKGFEYIADVKNDKWLKYVVGRTQ